MDNYNKKAWDKLPAETKTAMLVGSSMVAAISANLDKPAHTIIEMVIKKYPDFPKAKMLEGLKQIAKIFCFQQSKRSLERGFKDLDMEIIIKLLQEYTKELQYKMLDPICYTLAAVFALVVASPQTRFDEISGSMIYCYRTFVKDQIEKQGDTSE